MKGALDELRRWGCDVRGALDRMAGDEAFYMECLGEVAEDPYFPRLGEALNAGDIPGAFDAAHTLKGVLANVGLTPMYDQIIRIVEPLRIGASDGICEEYAQLMRMREKLCAVIAQE